MKDEKGKHPEDLKTRTKRFALRIVRLYCALPKTTAAQVMGKQMLRSGTSVGAHNREAVRSRSTAEFISKIEGAQGSRASVLLSSFTKGAQGLCAPIRLSSFILCPSSLRNGLLRL